MGRSFYMSFTRTLGIMFYDIKFKGEAVMYELSMQEATAQYGQWTILDFSLMRLLTLIYSCTGGNQPKGGSTVYHDTYYSLGAVGQLIELLSSHKCNSIGLMNDRNRHRHSS
jgi:primary-amine oxidase